MATPIAERIMRTTDSRPGRSTPGKGQTRRPARPSSRSTRPPRSPRRRRAGTRVMSIHEAETPPGPRSKHAWPHSKTASVPWRSRRGWRRPRPCSRALRPGDEVVAAADLYGGTFRLLERVFKPWGLVPRYTEDPSPQGFARRFSRRHQDGLDRDADQPAFASHRHRRRGARGPSPRRAFWSWTIRSLPLFSRGRSSWAPIWWCTARRNTWAATPTSSAGP